MKVTICVIIAMYFSYIHRLCTQIVCIIFFLFMILLQTCKKSNHLLIRH